MLAQSAQRAYHAPMWVGVILVLAYFGFLLFVGMAHDDLVKTMLAGMWALMILSSAASIAVEVLR